MLTMDCGVRGWSGGIRACGIGGFCQTPSVIGEDAASVVRRHVDAFNARDLDTLMAGFTEDVS